MKSSVPFLLLSAVVVFSSVSKALTSGAMQLIDFETKSNAVAFRNNTPIAMPHLEIPLSAVEFDFADRFSPSIAQHLIFEKEGLKYVRWVVNPEDTKWHKQVIEHFAKKGLNLAMKFYFTGYQTASRSYIVEDPGKTIQFSIKGSTDKTGGYWADKKQSAEDAKDTRVNADFVMDLQRRLKFDNVIIMDEPATINLTELDQAIIVRDLAGLNNTSGKIYLPGFSALHESTGKEIALKNGSNDPFKFWTENYIRPVGKALGEFAARTGMQFDSPHSQNFLIELDSNYKPTGRIVFRDMADLWMSKSVMSAAHPNIAGFLAKFTSANTQMKEFIPAGFGPLHGNTAPTWIPTEKYATWGNVFFSEFENSFEKYSGLKAESFKQKNGAQSGAYFLAQYRISETAPGTQEFWNNLKNYKTPRGNLNCSFVLLMD